MFWGGIVQALYGCCLVTLSIPIILVICMVKAVTRVSAVELTGV